MKDKKITYHQLKGVLLAIGYAADAPSGNHVVFRHPDSELFVVLPRLRRHDVVKPIDLLSVQNALANSGVVAKEEFDSLFIIQKGDSLIWTEPLTGKELEVTAASNESDGTVIIKQAGAFSPCPVDQLRKVDLTRT